MSSIGAAGKGDDFSLFEPISKVAFGRCIAINKNHITRAEEKPSYKQGEYSPYATHVDLRTTTEIISVRETPAVYMALNQIGMSIQRLSRSPSGVLGFKYS